MKSWHLAVLLLMAWLIGFWPPSAHAQAPAYEWAKSIGSTGTDWGFSIGFDDLGNTYTVGGFSGTVDFDPGPGTFYRSSAGGIDIYILKLDRFGNFVWAKTIGGYSDEVAYGVAVDPAGNVHLAGGFNAYADFDPGPAVFLLSSVSLTDAFVLKLDANGNFVWAKRFGGGQDDVVYEIAVDIAGNVYTTGSFSGNVDFDPGSGSYFLSTTQGLDIFVQKLDVNGDFLWARSFGGATTNDIGFGIVVDSVQNVYSTGYFNGQTDFDPGPGIHNIWTTGGTDVYVQKLDVNGQFVWVRTFGSSLPDVPSDIHLDNFGNLYTTGYFRASCDFDPGPGTDSLFIVDGWDAFIHKMDTAGNYKWARAIAGTSHENGQAVATDPSGNVYATGYFYYDTDFDPGPATYSITSTNSIDAYLLELDSAGNFIWVGTFGGTANQYCEELAINRWGQIFVTGEFGYTVDLDPGPGQSNFVSAGDFDQFVLKFNPCNSTSGSESRTECSSYFWPSSSETYASSGTYTAVVANADGCDSTVTLNLTIIPPSFGTDVQTACLNYTWMDGITYTNSTNTPTHYLTNSIGCDSIVTLNLTINQPSFATAYYTACSSYTWIDGNTYTASTNSATYISTNSVGCDSIITLDLTILPSSASTDFQTACGSFTWIDGNTYNSSNNWATYYASNSYGCDSVITLNLTINQPSFYTDQHTACDSFTWLDGNTYTSSNNSATVTLTNSAGCDSIINLDLNIVQPSFGTDIQSSCSPFTWIDGITYASSNATATHTLTSSAGCDSTVTLNLTIHSPSFATDVQSACSSYTWIDGITYTSSNNTATFVLANAAGCDSLITLDLSIHQPSSSTEVISACDSYTWIDGNTYSAPFNVATFTLSNSFGCDSVITLNLSIQPSPIATLSNTGNSLQASPSGLSYQWIDCNNGNQAINGATNEIFMPTSSGSYAVVVTDGSCSDTSVCLNFILIGIEDGEVTQLQVFPNPTNGMVYISSAVRIVSVEVYDAEGKLVGSGNSAVWDLSEFASGTYIFRIEDENGGVWSRKVVKD